MAEKQQPAADGDRSTTTEAEPNPPVWHTCGQHRFYRRDDVLYWECHGPMNLPELIDMFEERLALQRQYGRVFLLIDAHGTDSIPAESRRHAAQFKPDPPIRGAVVMLGAGLLTRTAVSLIAGAARLVSRREITNLFFADDEAEAWAILERQRIILSTEPPPA